MNDNPKMNGMKSAVKEALPPTALKDPSLKTSDHLDNRVTWI